MARVTIEKRDLDEAGAGIDGLGIRNTQPDLYQAASAPMSTSVAIVAPSAKATACRLPSVAMDVTLRPHLIVPAEATVLADLEARPCLLPDERRCDRWVIKQDVAVLVHDAFASAGADEAQKRANRPASVKARWPLCSWMSSRPPCGLALAVASASQTVAATPFTCRTRANINPPKPCTDNRNLLSHFSAPTVAPALRSTLRLPSTHRSSGGRSRRRWPNHAERMADLYSTAGQAKSCSDPTVCFSRRRSDQ